MGEGTDDVWVRPMRGEDVPVAERVTAAAYDGGGRSPVRAEAWRRRTTHLVATDPGGCWVAEERGEVVGIAASFTRELMWILASYAVRPGLQGRGTGRMLLAAALHHGRGCLRGMLSSSADPAAVRRYRHAGFELHPQMYLTGTVDRAALPVVERVRDGSASDVDLMDSVDRRARGAAHGADHEVLLATAARLVVTDRPTGQGYAYLAEDGAPLLLAATSRRIAADLAWEALASVPPGAEVSLEHVTAANQWALDVGLAAGLSVGQLGYLALRHCKPPAPYLHHGSLL